MRKIGTLPVLPLLAVLTGCGPSKDEVASAVGSSDISDVNCTAAVGQPGYVCTFEHRGYQLTRRLVKRESGSWDAAY
jgi:hypothetical protein